MPPRKLLSTSTTLCFESPTDMLLPEIAVSCHSRFEVIVADVGPIVCELV
ncbi:unnamed protein product [Penicillium salamii]|nr:unnamed protein product [Penicillium salamii]